MMRIRYLKIEKDQFQIIRKIRSCEQTKPKINFPQTFFFVIVCLNVYIIKYAKTSTSWYNVTMKNVALGLELVFKKTSLKVSAK